MRCGANFSAPAKNRRLFSVLADYGKMTRGAAAQNGPKAWNAANLTYIAFEEDQLQIFELI